MPDKLIKIKLVLRQALHSKLWLRRWLLWRLLRGGHERGKVYESVSQFGVNNVLQALVSGGPLSVSFMVYDDFMTYKSGVYHHIALLSGPFQPLEVKTVKPTKVQIHVQCSMCM